MLELREYDNDTNHQHIWFPLNTEEEAIDIMLKRCFGKSYVHKKVHFYGTNRFYTDDSTMVLFQRNPNGRVYDFDDVIGPSTVKTYEICYI